MSTFTHKAESASLNKFASKFWEHECRVNSVLWFLNRATVCNSGGTHHVWAARRHMFPTLDWSSVAGKAPYMDGDWGSLADGIRTACRRAFDEYSQMFLDALTGLFAGKEARVSSVKSRFRTEYAGIKRGGWGWMSAGLNMGQCGQEIHQKLADHFAYCFSKSPLVCLCGKDRNDWFAQTARGVGFGEYRYVLEHKDIPPDVAYVFPETALTVPCITSSPWDVEYDAGMIMVYSYLAFVFQKPSLFVRVQGTIEP